MSPDAASHQPDIPVSAILNTLDGSVALLDPHGVILAVNTRWREIVKKAGLALVPGQNLPASYQHVGGALAAEAARIAREIGVVLAGERPDFHDEGAPWPMSPEGGQRFRLTVKALPERAGAIVTYEDTSQRHEEAARRAEERLRHLIDHATDIIYSCDLNGCFTFVNQPAVRLMKYDEPELLGRHFLSLIRPDYRDRAGEFYAKQLLEKIPSTYFEFPAVTKDGAEIWFGQNVELVRDRETVVGVQAVARDITRQKAAEDALQESETRFRVMAEASPVGIFLTGPNGTTVYSNPKSLAIADITFEQALGFGWRDALHPDDRDRVMRAWIESAANRSTFSSTHRYVRTDGSIVWARVHVAPMLDLGELRGFVGVIEDITERHVAEEALKASEAKFRGLFENTQEGVFQSTPEGKLLTVNPAFIAMLGYSSAEELLKLDIARDLYATPQLRTVFWERLKRDGTVRDFESECRRKDGQTITTLTSARLARSADGRILYCEGVLVDITERRGLEAQLRQAQKMESIGRLAGGVAHDFNNLLTAILGYAEFTAEYLPPDNPGRANLEQLLIAAHRASDLTKQLLAFARRQMIEPRVIDLNELVANSEKILRRMIGEDIELTTRLASTLSGVRVDPVQFERILMNLAVNARDAMPAGGQMTIETADVVLDEDTARRHPGMRAGSHVMLAVTDNGVGMSEEVRAHLFEPFFTTKEPGRGTGLGLATCYGIVKQAGGYILADSQPGRGATFRIYLPTVEEPVTPLQRAAPMGILSGGGLETILLVEDERLVREMAAESLRSRGYTVLTAESSQSALDLNRNYRDPIHLLVTDVVMPGSTGRQLAGEIQRERPELKVIYLSGYSDDAITPHGIVEGGVTFLPKPFTPMSLTDKVREVLTLPGQPA